MIQQVLSLGRKISIYCVITAHLLYEKNNQKLYTSIQNEIHKLVWFKNNQTNVKQLRYCLEQYWSIEPKMVTKLTHFDRSSRWICLNRCPRYVVGQHLIEILPD